MKTSRLLALVLGLMLGGFSSFAFSRECAGTYESGAAALAACRAGEYGSLVCGASNYASLCGTESAYSLNFSGTQYDPYGFNASGGCGAGLEPDANGKCVPATGPSPEALAAGDAAAAAAAADGLDQAAQDAARAAAESAYTDWISAGKTVAEAQRAAASSGVIGAVENMQGRLAPAYEQAKTQATACLAAGQTGCGSYYDAVDTAALAMGWDVTNPPVLCFGVGCGQPSGENHLYIADVGGGWSVVSDPGDGSGLIFGGHVDGFPLGPTQTESTTYGSMQPSSEQVVTSTTGHAGGKVITQTSDGGGALVVARSDGVTEIYYFDSQTHQQDAVAVVQSTGASACTGDCSGKNPVNDIINSGGAVGSGGGGGSSSPLPGETIAKLNQMSDAVTGTGDGAGSLDGINGEKGAFNAALDALGDAVEGAGGAEQPPSGWTWFPSFPAASCEAWAIPRGDGGSIALDPCPAAAWIRDVGAYLLYFMTALGLFNILTGKKEQA